MSSLCNHIQMFDGWELNGNVFPGEHDHSLSLDQRSRAQCSGLGATNYKKFTSHQNAALASFKIPTPGQGFKIRVTYHPNPDSKFIISYFVFIHSIILVLACNILMSDMTGLFTLQNHGKARNCSLTTLLFPANFELHSVNVGPGSARQRRALAASGTQ